MILPLLNEPPLAVLICVAPDPAPVPEADVIVILLPKPVVVDVVIGKVVVYTAVFSRLYFL